VGRRAARGVARLIVRVGINLQEGQERLDQRAVEHAPLVRAVAGAAYAAGARYVDPYYADYHVSARRSSSARRTCSTGRRRTSSSELESVAERRGARVSLTAQADRTCWRTSTAPRRRVRA